MIPSVIIKIEKKEEKLTFKEFTEMMDQAEPEDRERLVDYLSKYAELQEIKIQLAMVGLDKNAIDDWAPSFIGKPMFLNSIINMFAYFGRDGLDAMVHELVYGR